MGWGSWAGGGRNFLLGIDNLLGLRKKGHTTETMAASREALPRHSRTDFSYSFIFFIYIYIYIYTRTILAQQFRKIATSTNVAFSTQDSALVNELVFC